MIIDSILHAIRTLILTAIALGTAYLIYKFITPSLTSIDADRAIIALLIAIVIAVVDSRH